jgi:hypothetical protein
MAEVYKILGQVATTDTTEQVLYTSPASTQAIITNITAVNRTSSAQTFDVNVYDTVKTSGDLVDVATNTFVAVSAPFQGGTTAASSTDGITWTLRTMPAIAEWYVTYGNSTFVAIGYYTGVAASSTNGTTWTARTPSTSNLRAVTFGNNTFVAVGSYWDGTTNASSSTDGITWTTRTLPASGKWKSVTYGNGIFVTVSDGSANAASSTNGITWTTRTMPSSANWRAVTYGNGIFVAVENDFASTKAASSTDGITWTARTLSTGGYWNAVAYGNGVFVATAGYSTAASSTDGITWTTRTLPAFTFSGWKAVTYGNGIFVAVAADSTTAASSTDGITWTLRTLPVSTGWSSVTYGIPNISYSSPQLNNIYKGATIQANASEILEPGIVLGAQNSIVVKGTANTTFSVYGVELT